MAKQNLLVTTWQTEHHSACFDAGQDKRKKEKKGLAGGLIINLSATSVLLDVLGPRSSMCFYQGVAHTPTMTDVLAVKGTVDLFG